MPAPITIDSDLFDKGLNDRMFDKQLMKPLTGWITSSAAFERDFREEVFATGEKE
jgi:hypothetical protein